MELEQNQTINMDDKLEHQSFIIKDLSFIQTKYPYYTDLCVTAERNFFLALKCFNQQLDFQTAIFLVNTDNEDDQMGYELLASRLQRHMKLVFKEIQSLFEDQLFYTKNQIIFKKQIYQNEEEEFPQVWLIEYDLYPKDYKSDQIKNFEQKLFTHEELQAGVYQYVRNLIIDKQQFFLSNVSQLLKTINELEEKNPALIMKTFKKCQNLEKLTLHIISYYINLADLEDLASAFSECKQLKVLCLYLSENNINKSTFSYLLQCIEKLSLINRLELNIRGNLVEQDSFIGMGRVIRNLKSLENLQLNLSKTGFDASSLEILAQGISENQNINSLLFSAYQSGIEREMLKILVKKFGKMNLEKFDLYLSQNNLVYTDFEIFNQNFQNYHKLKLLHLCLSGVDNSQGLSDFALSIGQLTNLNALKLYFRKNQIPSKEIAEVGKNISKLTDLKQLTLVLKRNNFSEPLLQQFAKDLSQCKNLESLKLNLNFCQLDQYDIVLFTESLASISKLKHLKLKLKGNEIEQQQLISIFQNLQKCRVLSQLTTKMSLNKINQEGIEAMIQKIVEIKSLIRLSIRLVDYFIEEDDFLFIGDKIRQQKNILVFQLSFRNIDQYIISNLTKKISKARRMVEYYVKSW